MTCLEFLCSLETCSSVKDPESSKTSVDVHFRLGFDKWYIPVDVFQKFKLLTVSCQLFVLMQDKESVSSIFISSNTGGDNGYTR